MNQGNNINNNEFSANNSLESMIPIIGVDNSSNQSQSIMNKSNGFLEVNDGKTKISLPTTDGFTVDYNALYNVAPSAEELFEQSKANNKVDEDSLIFNSLNIADTPSFNIPEEVVEEEFHAVVPEIKAEDLISVNIDEPDNLPVANIGIKKMDKVMSNESLPNNNIFNSNNQMVQNSNINMNQTYSTMNEFGGNNIQSNMMSQNYVTGNNINNGSFQQNMVNQNSNMVKPLLRENEDTRAEQYNPNANRTARFISNDDTKYTIKKSEPVVVNMPTDPNLIANPLAIFGASAGTIRPTSAEAMRQNTQPNVEQPNMPTVNNMNPNQNMQQNKVMTCPSCGFIVKPGQPTCVVCGCRL